MEGSNPKRLQIIMLHIDEYQLSGDVLGVVKTVGVFL